MRTSEEAAATPSGPGPRTPEDVAAIEATYEPFDPVAAWAGTPIDEARWRRHADALREAVGRADQASWRHIQERFLRAAALDSAALAELIRPAPDLTAVVLRSSLTEGDWAAVVEANRLVVECHRRALVVAADAAAARRPVDEHLIATVQDLIVESQETYTVTVHGGAKTEVELPRRQYKSVSNYLIREADHSPMAFTPVTEVADEMRRLTAELASEAFGQLHPVAQAAYIHVALIRVHPFADGNGRLARTLASIPLLREVGLPQLILSDQWPTYLQALARAYRGDAAAMVELFLACQINAMDLARSLLEADTTAPETPPAATLPAIAVAPSAERTLLDLAEVHVREAIGVPAGDARITVAREGAGADEIRIVLADTAGHVQVDVHLSVRPGDRAGWLDLTATSGHTLELWRHDVYPAPVEIAHLRVRAWLDALFRDHAVPSAAVSPARGLFVLGVPRSGTTMVGSYIGSHPAVLNLAEYGALYIANSVAPAYLRRLPGHGHDGFLAGLRALAVDHATRAARQQGCSWFCDATPWNLEIAASLVESLPDAVFVLMLRHFSGCVLSLRQFDWVGKSVDRAARLWVTLNGAITQLPEDRTLVIGYDALAQNPASTVAAVRDALSTLGLDPGGFDDRQLATSHAHVVGRPRPTIAEVIDDRVELHAIASLDAERWTSEVHARVWPIVGEMHRALADRFRDVYVSPPRPSHVAEDEW